MNTFNFDILIIGAGLAGLNAACKLLKNPKIKVGLIALPRASKNNPARLTFTDVLDEYGLDDCAFNNYSAFGLFSYFGTTCIHRYNKPVFASLNYKKACEKLEDTLKKSDNFVRITDRVTDIRTEKDRVNLYTQTGKHFSSNILIDASGQAHLSYKFLKKERPKLYSHSYGQYFENTKNANSDEALFIAPSVDYGSGGGWFYPYGKDQASVGFAIVTDSPQFPSKTIRKQYKNALNEIDFLRTNLNGARPKNFEFGTIPIDPAKEFVFDRILVLGDAAGQATPWICMGVEPVLKNSDLAARIVLRAYEKNRFDKLSLIHYQNEWNRQNEDAFKIVTDLNPKIWFLGEAAWDFTLEADLRKLSPQQFYERIRYNKHLMPKYKALFRWTLFRLRHLFEWQKYKRFK